MLDLPFDPDKPAVYTVTYGDGGAISQECKVLHKMKDGTYVVVYDDPQPYACEVERERVAIVPPRDVGRFLRNETQDKWVNIYINSYGQPLTPGELYPTREDAESIAGKEGIRGNCTYHATVRVPFYKDS